MAFNLDDYVPVAERIDAFWLSHRDDDAAIMTDLVEAGDKRVVVKATISLGDRIVATGYAEEVRGDGKVNTTSAVENCETSAIGRALANYGMTASKAKQRASLEEMEKVERHTLAAMSTEQLLADVDRLAAALGQSPELVTEKWRTQRGDGLGHDDLAQVPVAELAEFVGKLRSFARRAGVRSV